MSNTLELELVIRLTFEENIPYIRLERIESQVEGI